MKSNMNCFDFFGCFIHSAAFYKNRKNECREKNNMEIYLFSWFKKVIYNALRGFSFKDMEFIVM